MPVVADLIVSALLDAGVRTMFGVPGGGGNLDLIAAAERHGLRFVLTSTETGAAIAAIAQAEITGRPGACLTTVGPGATSVVNGVACAFLDRAPVIVFTDSQPGGASGRFEHQRLDHGALMSSLTKWSATLTAEGTCTAIRQALRTATADRPGPVHLDCPGDVLSAAHDGKVIATAREATPSTPPAAPVDASKVRSLLATARKPLLLVGLGGRRTEDAKAIRELCTRAHVPAMVTYKAKGVVPDSHPWFAGVFTNASIERPILDESDLMIGVGLDPVELLPRPWTHDAPVIYCGRWAVETAHVPFAGQLITEIADLTGEMASALPPSEWDAERLRSQVADQQRRISIEGKGLTSQRLVQVAAGRLASFAGRVTVDAGAHMLAATMLWPVCGPNRLLISNGLSTMGFALPAAIGAALLQPDRPVVVLTGDGGLLMCAGELLTIARERLRVIVIVFNDTSLSLIEIKQQARQLAAAGVALGSVDWVTLAESFGLRAWVATDEPTLDRAVAAASECDGPCLIDARIDRSNYQATLRAVRGST
jgi:acetolactate synthase I/II/III large subunit